MPKTITKSHKPASSPGNTNGQTAPTKKIPIRDTLPPETNPEILRANRLLIKVATAIRENREREQQEQGEP